jgi:hypothetical protein
VTTKAAASAAVAIEFLRRVDVMSLPACPPSFVRQCVDRPDFAESKAEFQPGKFALVKCSVD